MDLRVFYGFAKLTSKVVRKAELAVFFENDNHNARRNEEYIRKILHVVYIRNQTPGEAADAKGSNRMFTKYSYFIDEKPWRGDIDRALRKNFLADENNVSLQEREEIREKLRAEYFKVYGRRELPQLKLQL
jgi:hypothetical protein